MAIESDFENNNDLIAAAEAADDVNYWLYSPGEQANKWDEFYEQGIMAIGWSDLGSLRKYKSQQEMREALQDTYNTNSSRNDARAVWDFSKEIYEGDIVFVKRGRTEILGRGIVRSKYYYDRKRKEYRHSREVKWVNKGLWHVTGRYLALKTLTNITNDEDQVEMLKQLFSKEKPAVSGTEVTEKDTVNLQAEQDTPPEYYTALDTDEGYSTDVNKSLTLGITSIGDLLLKNKITKIGYGEKIVSLENIRLKIPVYQRPYKWSAKNANQLLDDIEEALIANKEMYRVGTLILHKERVDKESRSTESNNIVYNIVDGQQRVITFSLLLKILQDAPIAFLQQKLACNTFNLKNVATNYNALQRRLGKLLDKKDERDKKELLDYIKGHCELIVVITEDESEAFQFFDSQNARGKALYPHDLLKAFHLREMGHVDVAETERIVGMWENLDQKALAVLFKEYLYRLKEWIKGNRPEELTEHNIEMFKGITAKDSHPFAQFYKGAFAYANELNHSFVPFVAGQQKLCSFQLNAPVVAGKPFFEFAKHYFDILADIQNNDKYEGYFINDNEIVKTLDLRDFKNGTGNRIVRLLFDTAILLYVDRFCPSIPSKSDLDYLDQFVIYAFVWAYSLRAQYYNVGWLVAHNYVMGKVNKKDVKNGFNIYKTITDADSPGFLLSVLAERIEPLATSNLEIKDEDKEKCDETKNNGVYKHYLHFFKVHRFWIEGQEN